MADPHRDDLIAALARDRGTALTGYAYLLTGDLPRAEDLVQDAMVKVFARLRAGFTPDAAEAYVRRTILTTYLDGYRRTRLWGTVGRLASVSEVVEGHETRSADRMDLQAALAVLSPRERAAVVLRFYEDLTVPEVARQMGLAEGTVKRYLSDAVRRLEARLGPLPDADVDTVLVTTTPRPTRTRS